MKWKCAKCGFETFKDPRDGNQKAHCFKCKNQHAWFQMFRLCKCNKWFHAESYRQMLCSWECRSAEMKGRPSSKKGQHYPWLQRARIGNCLSCGKEYRAVTDSKSRKQKYCSKECYAKKNPPKKLECCVCKNTFVKRVLLKKDDRKNAWKYCSINCYNNDLKSWRSKKHNPDISKSDFASDWYKKLHRWVQLKLGKPKECWGCGFTSENSRQFQWANIDHQYRKKLSDWLRLCGTCHRFYDKGEKSEEWLKNVKKKCHK